MYRITLYLKFSKENEIHVKVQFEVKKKKKAIKVSLTLQELNITKLKTNSQGNYIIHCERTMNNDKKIRYSVLVVINHMRIERMFGKSLSKNARFTGEPNNFSAHFSMEYPLLIGTPYEEIERVIIKRREQKNDFVYCKQSVQMTRITFMKLTRFYDAENVVSKKSKKDNSRFLQHGMNGRPILGGGCSSK